MFGFVSLRSLGVWFRYCIVSFSIRTSGFCFSFSSSVFLKVGKRYNSLVGEFKLGTILSLSFFGNTIFFFRGRGLVGWVEGRREVSSSRSSRVSLEIGTVGSSR